jgi:LuxR family transcriptional regulator, maltose regulon positive regulatory protein
MNSLLVGVDISDRAAPEDDPVADAVTADALGYGALPAAGHPVRTHPTYQTQTLLARMDLAEPDGVLSVFLLHPVPGLLERQARQRTAHPAVIAEILGLLAGQAPKPAAAPPPLLEPLSDSEIRVLRYLPTNLTGPEIAGELYVSHNTVRTHLRHLYAKLGTHTRAEAVARARALGLLAPGRII